MKLPHSVVGCLTTGIFGEIIKFQEIMELRKHGFVWTLQQYELKYKSLIEALCFYKQHFVDVESYERLKKHFQEVETNYLKFIEQLEAQETA